MTGLQARTLRLPKNCRMSERQIDEELHPVQLEILRKMSPDQRLRLAGELTRATWNRALAAVARAHPGLSDAHLAEQVYPGL